MNALKLIVLTVALSFAPLLLTACTENKTKTAADCCAVDPLHASQHAECIVCKHNADLACVDVDIDKDTPRASINGHEYFFCSEACKKECVAHPEKYLSRK